MILRDDADLSRTRQKLRELEERYEARRIEPAVNPHVRELTLHSLKQVINQLKEEIVLYEVRRQPAGQRS